MSRTFPPSDTPLTEADMQAFADGNLSPERAAHVRKYLGSRPVEAERIAFYRQLNMQMRSVFESAFAPRVHVRRADPEHGATVRSTLRGSVIRRVGVALLGVVLAVLVASGWLVASRVSPEMLDAAAVMAWMRASGQPVSQASAAVPGDPYAVDLVPVGFKLVAARTRHPHAFASIDVLDYRNADGEPVVLLSAPAPFAANQPHWTAQRIGHLRLLSWTVDGRRYVIAGHATTHGLMRAADALTSR